MSGLSLLGKRLGIPETNWNKFAQSNPEANAIFKALENKAEGEVRKAFQKLDDRSLRVIAMAALWAIDNNEDKG